MCCVSVCDRVDWFAFQVEKREERREKSEERERDRERQRDRDRATHMKWNERKNAGMLRITVWINRV